MCFKGAEVSSSDQVTQRKQAALAQEQYDDHQERYVPNVEKPLLDYIQDKGQPEVEAQKALTQSYQKFDQANDMADRNNRRYGVNLTQKQKESLDSRRNLAKVSSGISNSTQARNQTDDYQGALRDSVIQLGRQIEAGGSTNLNSAAGMEAGRANRNAQNKANAHNSMVNTGLQAGGMALLAFSDKNKKKNRKKVDGKSALAKVRGMNIEKWEYKKGQGPKGEHTGPMYQNAPEEIKRKDVKAIDIHDEVQMGMAAIKEIADKVDRIERRVH